MTPKVGDTYEYNSCLYIICSINSGSIRFCNLFSGKMFSLGKITFDYYIKSNVINPCDIDITILPHPPGNYASIPEQRIAHLFLSKTHVYFHSSVFHVMVNLSTGSVIPPRNHYSKYLDFECIINPQVLSWEF